jgi:hypothetical protein
VRVQRGQQKVSEPKDFTETWFEGFILNMRMNSVGNVVVAVEVVYADRERALSLVNTAGRNVSFHVTGKSA